VSLSQRKIRGFQRWVKAGPKEMEPTLLRSASALVAPLEAAGFECAEKAFDGSAVPAHSLNLERRSPADQVDFVLIIFDKRRRLRFQIIFGSKHAAAPYAWVRSGALVWRPGSEQVKFKWWGAKWWNLSKVETFCDAVNMVIALMPQAVEYLSSGKVGAHVYADPIPA
jgi:hypothetical protein